MKSLANLYAFFMGGRAYYKLGSYMKGSLIVEVGIEGMGHAGLSLRHYWDPVVRCLLGLYEGL
jgi:hypothetical protein